MQAEGTAGIGTDKIEEWIGRKENVAESKVASLPPSSSKHPNMHP